MECVAGEKWRDRAAMTRPEREAARGTLERLELAQRGLHARPDVARIDPGQREGGTEIGGGREHERAGGTLLEAPERILEDVASAFTETDERSGRQLDMKAADVWNDAGRHRQRLRGIRRSFSVRGHALRRHCDFHRHDLFERIA